MHFLTLVLVPDSNKTTSEILGCAHRMLTFYDRNLREPWTEYGEPENPFGEWDWMTLGGRWDGVVTGQAVDWLASKRRREPFGSRVKRNLVKVRKLPPNLVPGAIITPDGQWHDEYEDFGQWSKDADPRWRELVHATFKMNSECYAVAVDCHS